MERKSKKCWTIVVPTVRTKVARLWWNREEAAAYLREMYDRTLTKRQELQQAVAKVPDSKKWGDTRTAADVDLARVYVVAIQCLECTTYFDTYKEFEQAMNQATVRQLASRLVGDPPWATQDLYQAQGLVLRPQGGTRA